MSERDVFILLDGMKTQNGIEAIVKINKKNLDKFCDFLVVGKTGGRYEGLKKIKVMTTKNPDALKLSELRMKNSFSRLTYYYFSEQFKEKYGPFTETRIIDILDNQYALKEDRDEVDYDEMNHIDDRILRRMYDNIKGVVDVRKVEDEEYEVEIS